MPLKVVISLSAVIISGQGDTSIAKSLNADSQVVTRGQL